MANYIKIAFGRMAGWQDGRKAKKPNDGLMDDGFQIVVNPGDKIAK